MKYRWYRSGEVWPHEEHLFEPVEFANTEEFFEIPQIARYREIGYDLRKCKDQAYLELPNPEILMRSWYPMVGCSGSRFR